MTDIIFTLPLEIVNRIFSFLDQRDCVECLKVCRCWFKAISTYPIALWEQVEISPDSWNRKKYAMLQCLGQQVRSVYIESQDAYEVLKHLAERRCGIQTLDITRHVHSQRIRSYVDSSMLLPGIIRYFSHTLTELAILSHTCDISMPMLLDTLPLLTHLSVMFDRPLSTDATPEQVDGRNRHERPPIHNNLIFLRLDSALSFKDRIHPLLQRCPRIKFLILAPRPYRIIVPTSDINTAFELCPLLRYIVWNRSDADIVDGWQSLSKRWSANIKETTRIAFNDDVEGTMARALVFAVTDHQSIMPIVERSQPILEQLRIDASGVHNTDWWATLVRNQFTQLTSLELENIVGLSSEQWAQLFSMQPQIEHLEIRIYTGGTRYLNTIIAVIRTLRLLRLLALRNTIPMLDENPFCDLTGLHHLQQLEELRLMNIPIDNQGLVRLCEPTQQPLIKKLSLCCIYAYDNRNVNTLTEAGWIGLVQRLRETKILVLELNDVQGVTDAVLEHLARVESLVLLRISRVSTITDAGVNAFRIISAGSKEFGTKIEVRRCPRVSSV